jgi:hypothetical protein
MELPLGHAIPPVGLGDGAATCEHGEHRVGAILQKEPYFPPPVWKTECLELEVGINFTAGSDEDVVPHSSPALTEEAKWRALVVTIKRCSKHEFTCHPTARTTHPLYHGIQQPYP